MYKIMISDLPIANSMSTRWIFLLDSTGKEFATEIPGILIDQLNILLETIAENRVKVVKEVAIETVRSIVNGNEEIEIIEP